MCGRFVSASPSDVLADYFAVEDRYVEPLAPNYNVAPTDEVYAVVEHERRRLLRTVGWGLVTADAVDPGRAALSCRQHARQRRAQQRA